MSNSFGRVFRMTTWGESHGPTVGVVVDGCPAKVPLDAADVQRELNRRRPGQSSITTARKEEDQIRLLSGVHDGLTLGTPIAMVVENSDARSNDYDTMREVFRPSHADYTYQAKFGIRDWRGGGRASARETIGRVAAGAVAKRILSDVYGVDIVAYVRQVWTICADVDPCRVTAEEVEQNEVRCPDAEAAARMHEEIRAARKAGDSLGGVVEAVARGLPPGWGEPVFGKLDAELAAAMLSIPACKGFEVGSGFGGVAMTGSEHNDPFYADGTRIRTRSNHSGGVLGGISNGEDILLRAAFKPTATIMREQETVDAEGRSTTLMGRGRHDPCVVPRAVPIVEAMMALVLCDAAMSHRARHGLLDAPIDTNAR